MNLVIDQAKIELSRPEMTNKISLIYWVDNYIVQ